MIQALDCDISPAALKRATVVCFGCIAVATMLRERSRVGGCANEAHVVVPLAVRAQGDGGCARGRRCRPHRHRARWAGSATRDERCRAAYPSGRRGMKTSTDRILTTHVGSLVRPESIRAPLRARSRGEAIDEAELAARVEEAVAEVV